MAHFKLVCIYNNLKLIKIAQIKVTMSHYLYVRCFINRQLPKYLG
jgi:hypothetical protein